METQTHHNQIVIKTSTDNVKQKLPVNLLISLAAGAIAGVAIMVGILMGAEIILGL